MFTIILATLLSAQPAQAADPEPAPAKGRVVQIYDGDTLTLESGDRIRLRWVNTPELRPKEDYGVKRARPRRPWCSAKRST